MFPIGLAISTSAFGHIRETCLEFGGGNYIDHFLKESVIDENNMENWSHVQMPHMKAHDIIIFEIFVTPWFYVTGPGNKIAQCPDDIDRNCVCIKHLRAWYFFWGTVVRNCDSRMPLPQFLCIIHSHHMICFCVVLSLVAWLPLLG